MLYFMCVRRIINENPVQRIKIIVSASVLTLITSLQQPVIAEEDGETLFLDNCAECHLADGLGIAGIYPALAGNRVVLGSAVDVALVLIIGRGEMPSFGDAISNQDMATIINYVRNAWGNEGESISAQTIENLQ